MEYDNLVIYYHKLILFCMQKAAGFHIISWTILFCMVLHTTNTELT